MQLTQMCPHSRSDSPWQDGACCIPNVCVVRGVHTSREVVLSWLPTGFLLKEMSFLQCLMLFPFFPCFFFFFSNIGL